MACIVAGSLLPDVIDKAWWAFATSRHIPSGGRLFGHSLLACAVYALAGSIISPSIGRAVSFGALTHALLDVLCDLLDGAPLVFWRWLFWPLCGLPFPLSVFGVRTHVVYFSSDVVGGVAFVLVCWRMRRRSITGTRADDDDVARG